MADLNDLVIISKRIGANLDLVQGSGGNTSLKDGKVLWVKASGCRLKDAESHDIFVPVDHCAIIKGFLKNSETSYLTKDLPKAMGSELRPSIETTLHAIMPHRYVVHVHSVNAIASAVLQDGKSKITQLLDGINWSWVPYVRPGTPLTNSVRQVMRPGLNVLVLANHGLVLGGETASEVFELLNKLEDTLYRPRRDAKVIEEDKIKTLVKNTQYSPSKPNLIHSLAFDTVALSIVVNGPLYPDHIVFLGSGPMPVFTQQEVQCYLKENNRRITHQVIIVKGIGVIQHQSLSENAEEMLHCLANVLLRIQPANKLRYLSVREAAEIAEWEAEKYRQATQG